MTVKYTEPCVVANQDCEAPAGYGSAFGHYSNDYAHGGGAKHTCFSCGQPVCGKCSRTMDYYTYGRQRICWNCEQEHKPAPAAAE